ncbi:MAG: RNA polymerase sigma factor [Planctomycetaceae bacterium]|nr:RNA polymerase sigma factor [Planctomycetaceae bacterium]
MDNDTLPDWGRIVDTHAERVLRVALRVLGNAQDAEDASQEAFAEAFRLQQRGRVQNWTGLLIRLATLRSLDALRRRRHSQGLREEDWISRQEPFENAAAQELAQRLRHAISRLPEQQAAVFAMCHFEHLSRAEICASLGISSEAAATALYKARQRLQEQLAAIQQGDSR